MQIAQGIIAGWYIVKIALLWTLPELIFNQFEMHDFFFFCIL